MNKFELTVHDFLRTLLERAADKRLLGDSAGWLTVRQVLERAEGLAGTLHRLGIRRGDMIALRSYRSADTCLLLFALQMLGAAAVLTDLRQEPEDFLCSRGMVLPLRAVLSRDAGAAQWLFRAEGQEKPLAVIAGEAPPPEAVCTDPKLPGCIIFTSGSTGESKAVVLSQYNLINNLLDAEPLGDYRFDDVALGALPLDHVFGLVLLTGTVVLGYSVYFPERTEVPCILDAIGREKITRMNGVPSLYLAMAEQRRGYDLSSLRSGFIGGGPCTPEQFVSIEAALDMTLISAYGMSECVGITSASWRDPQSIRARSVGRFYARNTGKILRADGLEADPGEEGEICVDSHTRMLGYYGDASPREPLLRTGDLGYIDSDGFIYITGRKKEIIIRNGLNLSPRRIEEAMLSIPGVEDATVVGLPDEANGELPWAMAVCREELRPAVLNALGKKLVKNELPAGILYVDALPMTPSGKPDKQKIREVLARWKKA